MNNYKKITYFENQRRIKILHDFRKIVEEYFANVQYRDFGTEVYENEIAINKRQEINLVMIEVSRIADAAGISCTYTVYPAPAIGGFVRDVDAIQGIFHLCRN